jgi:hypothetical protein
VCGSFATFAENRTSISGWAATFVLKMIFPTIRPCVLGAWTNIRSVEVERAGNTNGRSGNPLQPHEEVAPMTVTVCGEVFMSSYSRTLVSLGSIVPSVLLASATMTERHKDALPICVM